MFVNGVGAEARSQREDIVEINHAVSTSEVPLTYLVTKLRYTRHTLSMASL
jgi:hypothetical protein